MDNDSLTSFLWVLKMVGSVCGFLSFIVMIIMTRNAAALQRTNDPLYHLVATMREQNPEIMDKFERVLDKRIDQQEGKTE